MAAGGNVVSEKENKRLEFTVKLPLCAIMQTHLQFLPFDSVAMQVMNAAADRASILPYIKMFQQLIRYGLIFSNTCH